MGKTNNITRHNRNNYKHNVIKKVNKHIQHINDYDTEINYYTKGHWVKRTIITYTVVLLILENRIISDSQETDITNNTIDTNTQTHELINNSQETDYK